jgi:hypothetical protein
MTTEEIEKEQQEIWDARACATFRAGIVLGTLSRLKREAPQTEADAREAEAILREALAVMTSVGDLLKNADLREQQLARDTKTMGP